MTIDDLLCRLIITVIKHLLNDNRSVLVFYTRVAFSRKRAVVNNNKRWVI